MVPRSRVPLDMSPPTHDRVDWSAAVLDQLPIADPPTPYRQLDLPSELGKSGPVEGTSAFIPGTPASSQAADTASFRSSVTAGQFQQTPPTAASGDYPASSYYQRAKVQTARKERMAKLRRGTRPAQAATASSLTSLGSCRPSQPSVSGGRGPSSMTSSVPSSIPLGDLPEEPEDLYRLIGVEPESAETATIGEAFRIYRQERRQQLEESRASSTAEAPEHPLHSRAEMAGLREGDAYVVLSQPRLRAWYDRRRRDWQQQEVLLGQYQKEIDRLSQEVVTQKRALSASKAEAEEQHALLVRRLLGMESRVSQEGSARTSADALKHQLTMQAQLEDLREELKQSQMREREHGAELDKLRKQKQQAELLREGLDQETMAASDKILQVAREEMETMRQEHRSKVAELEGRVAWHLENQKLVDDQLDVIQQQRDTIKDLRAKLARQEDEGLVNGETSDGRETARLKRRVRELETQLRRLIDGNQARDPFASLIQAAKPSEELERKLAMAQEKNQTLEVELEETRQDTEAQIRSLKQRFHQLQLQYKEATDLISDLPPVREASTARQTHQAPTSKRLAEAEARVEQLERALERKNAYLASRIREEKERGEKKIQALRLRQLRDSGGHYSSARRPGSSGAAPHWGRSPARAAATVGGQTSASRGGRLDQASPQKPPERQAPTPSTSYNNHWEGHAEEVVSGGSGGGGSSSGSDDWHDVKQDGESPQKPKSRRASATPSEQREEPEKKGGVASALQVGEEIHNLMQQLRAAEQEREAAAEALHQSKAAAVAAKHSFEARIQELELNQARLLRSVEEARVAGHARESKQLRREHETERHRLSTLLGQVETRNTQLEGELRTLLSALAKAETELRSRPRESPSLVQFQALRNKLDAMEARRSTREGELNSAIALSKEHGRLEVERLQTIHAAELSEKDAIIDRFRRELDWLLVSCRDLQVQYQQAAASLQCPGPAPPGAVRPPGASSSSRAPGVVPPVL